MKNKSKLLIPILISSLLFTGCGANEKASVNESIRYDNAAEEYYETPQENFDDAEIVQGESAEISDDSSSGEEKPVNTSKMVIRKEMLVYSCNMTVDVLDFDTAIDNLRESLDTYGAFPEHENYTDGKSSDKWVYDDVKSWKTYNATLRVPSEDYDEFCDYIANLGDLRSKKASVDNLTREYNDLSTTLEIYQAKEQRYIELLAEIDDKATAIAVENELTNIQIEISKLTTRMNEIQTDVAYSYVHLTINEVREYVEDEPVEEEPDTFFTRLKNTVSSSAKGFLSVMESLLFALIYLLPHAIVIGLFVFAIVSIVKFFGKRKMKKYQNYNPTMANPVNTPISPAKTPTPQTTAPANNPTPTTKTTPTKNSTETKTTAVDENTDK